MAKCVNCGSYTEYNNGLCTKCYNAKNSSATVTTAKRYNGPTFIEEQVGLSDRQYKFAEDMIKGRIAETLIEEMFVAMGYRVFRYGMENTVPGIMKTFRNRKSEVSKFICKAPDFIIQDEDGSNTHFVEVKFRASGCFSYRDLGENYPYEQAFVILVSKRHIKCLTAKELKDGNEITSTSQNFLGKRKEFETDKEIIKDFCDFATKFFDCV